MRIIIINLFTNSRWRLQINETTRSNNLHGRFVIKMAFIYPMAEHNGVKICDISLKQFHFKISKVTLGNKTNYKNKVKACFQ